MKTVFVVGGGFPGLVSALAVASWALKFDYLMSRELTRFSGTCAQANCHQCIKLAITFNLKHHQPID